MNARPGDRRMHYFALLSQGEQRAAIARLASSGMSDYGIAAASGLAVEQVRKILGELREAQAS